MRASTMSRLVVTPSSPSWIDAALGALPVILLDHAVCERKAAQTAIRHVSRHPDWPGLPTRLSRLAREELVHFERVLEELRRREIPFRPAPSARYAAELFAAARDTADEMLLCGLIEARSHERFVHLARRVEDARLRALYEDLLEAEARHGDIYLELAEEAAGSDVSARLAELVRHEAEVVARPGQPVRMHAGGA
jgi:tRNA-(ms[2]io[6]A)-hydroxylase